MLSTCLTSHYSCSHCAPPPPTQVTQEALGGADTHTTLSGVAHRSFENDVETLRATREFFDYLPLSWQHEGPVVQTEDSRDRLEPSLRYLVPDDANVGYDMCSVINKVRRVASLDHHAARSAWCAARASSERCRGEKLKGTAGRRWACVLGRLGTPKPG